MKSSAMNTEFKSKILAIKQLSVENETPVVKFVRPAAKNYPKDGWDRYLFVQDKPAYYLGTVCETCDFMFRKVPGDISSTSAKKISARLNQGLSTIDEEVLFAVSELLPTGDYVAFLIELLPVLVEPESEDDYFNHDIYTDFGDDDYNSSHAEYYRTDTKVIDESKSIFEFVAPMFDHETLNDPQVDAYRKSISQGHKPTALAVSILDTKWVHDFDDYDDLVERPYCLVHFMLDGHHKMYAAALEKRSITLLSIVSKVESIWYEENFDTLFQN